ncbi:hypothetical protein NM208_g3700 [Fusarium decemcellulare]|uniref:Uncharacterized protein n=1 Tax=Fusarium decemcellulare TaxID=57161 RepID=A0ACC1SN62_9HYPO|nr:hypothetical protein NM208_g3700 [Fusarium decemcellulare]
MDTKKLGAPIYNDSVATMDSSCAALLVIMGKMVSDQAVSTLNQAEAIDVAQGGVNLADDKTVLVPGRDKEVMNIQTSDLDSAVTVNEDLGVLMKAVLTMSRMSRLDSNPAIARDPLATREQACAAMLPNGPQTTQTTRWLLPLGVVTTAVKDALILASAVRLRNPLDDLMKIIGYGEAASKWIMQLQPLIRPTAQRDAAQVKQLTKPDVIEFFNKYFNPTSSEQARLSIHLHAQDKATTPKENVVRIERDPCNTYNAFHNKLQVCFLRHQVQQTVLDRVKIPSKNTTYSRIEISAFVAIISTYYAAYLNEKHKDDDDDGRDGDDWDDGYWEDGHEDRCLTISKQALASHFVTSTPTLPRLNWAQHPIPSAPRIPAKMHSKNFWEGYGASPFVDIARRVVRIVVVSWGPKSERYMVSSGDDNTRQASIDGSTHTPAPNLDTGCAWYRLVRIAFITTISAIAEADECTNGSGNGIALPMTRGDTSIIVEYGDKIADLRDTACVQLLAKQLVAVDLPEGKSHATIYVDKLADVEGGQADMVLKNLDDDVDDDKLRQMFSDALLAGLTEPTKEEAQSETEQEVDEKTSKNCGLDDGNEGQDCFRGFDSSSDDGYHRPCDAQCFRHGGLPIIVSKELLVLVWSSMAELYLGAPLRHVHRWSQWRRQVDLGDELSEAVIANDASRVASLLEDGADGSSNRVKMPHQDPCKGLTLSTSSIAFMVIFHVEFGSIHSVGSCIFLCNSVWAQWTGLGRCGAYIPMIQSLIATNAIEASKQQFKHPSSGWPRTETKYELQKKDTQLRQEATRPSRTWPGQCRKNDTKTSPAMTFTLSRGSSSSYNSEVVV